MVSLLDMLGLVLLLFVAGLVLWARAVADRSRVDMPETVLTAAVSRLPGDRRDWGSAMVAEMTVVRGPLPRWWFALGGLRVALLPPPTWRRMWTDFRTSGLGVTALMLAGVAACIATGVQVAAAYPGALRTDRAAFAAILLAYVVLAFALPRLTAPDRLARGTGVVAATAFTVLLSVESFSGTTYDDAGYALPATLLIFPVASALSAAAPGRSVAAGMQTALWGGVLSALAFATVATLGTLRVVRGGTHPVFLAEFARAKTAGTETLPDLASFQAATMGEHVGAAAVMLVLIPAWALLLGLVGSVLGARNRTARG